MDNEYAVLLGEIKGKLGQVIDNQRANDEKLTKRFDAIDTRFDSFDARLRTVEQKAAISGATAGAIISIAVAVTIEKLKTVLGVH